MKFLFQHFQAKKKEIIEVEIDKPTKVKFLTASEFKKYKMHRTHSYFGGLFEESPIRFVVPFDSVWHVVVEKGTHSDPLEVMASCRVMSPDKRVLSSVAADAPPHVREQAMLEGGGPQNSGVDSGEGTPMD